jgi:hypothetical protein
MVETCKVDEDTNGEGVPMRNHAPHHEDVWGICGATLHILDLGTVWKRWLAASNKLLYLKAGG